MGCYTSRFELSDIEECFESADLALHYSKLDAVELDLTYRKYSYDGFINESQWKSICSQLKLQKSKEIECFYQQFKEDKGYKLESMLVLGILLSSGSGETKARLIFEVFDKEDNKELNFFVLATMIDLISDSVSGKMKILVHVKKFNNLIEEDCKVYLEKLVVGREKLKTKLLVGLLGRNNSVSLERFIHRFRDAKKARLLSGVGFRRALRNNGNKLRFDLDE